MKDAYYFSHDTNARHDPKCSALIHEYGPEGYGVFWMIVEMLSEQNEYKLKKFNKLYEGLAAQFSIEHSRLRSIIEALLHDYELLLEDEKYIWSDSLMRRMEEKEKKRLSKVEAGRQGGLKSGITRSSKKTSKAETKQNEALLEANEPKESKVKEIKDIYSAFFEQVWLLYPNKKGKAQISGTQKAKLYKIGIEQLTKCIERYKSSKPDWQQYQNGSTFFNSGYVDYLDENYKESEKPKDNYRRAE